MFAKAWHGLRNLFRSETVLTDKEFLSGMTASHTASSGESVTPTTAITLSTYYACLRNISEDIGQVPLILYRKTGRQRVRAVDDPLYSVLREASNNETSAMSMREQLTHWAMGWGSGYAEIERNNSGDVIALWPIHPDRVTVKRINKKLVYDVKTNIDGGLTASIATVRYQAADIFHLKNFGGYSVLHMAMESLGSAIALQKFGAAFFGNGARPSGVVTTPQALKKEARDFMREEMVRMYAGAGNNGKLMLLSQGLAYEQLSIPNNESQYLESKEFSVEDIARWFRMPPSMIGSLRNPTGYSGLEQQAQAYVTFTLQPWAVRWEQEVQAKLIGYQRKDMFAEFLLEALMRGDSAGRGSFYRTLLQIGVMTPNEARERENLNPMEDESADKLYVQGAIIPLDKAGQQPEAIPQAAPSNETEDEPTPAAAVVPAGAMLPVLTEAAERLIRREAMATTKAITRTGTDPAAYKLWCAEFMADEVRLFTEAFTPALNSSCIVYSGSYSAADLQSLAVEYTTGATHRLMGAKVGTEQPDTWASGLSDGLARRVAGLIKENAR